MYSATTPKIVVPRGSLSEAEQSTIALFDRVSPSVVQVVGRQERAPTLVKESPGEAAQLLKALSGALPAAVAAFGEALRSRELPRPQDNDGTTEIDAAFANMVQWRADAAAVIRIVRAISRRTPMRANSG